MTTGFPTLPWRGGKHLVGPIVYFRNQAIPVERTPPRDTVDGNRWASCTSHHLACDCREAELNEQINELRAERNLVRNALLAATADHPTFVETRAGQRRRDLECRCDGCVAIRQIGAAHGLSFYENTIKLGEM